MPDPATSSSTSSTPEPSKSTTMATVKLTQHKGITATFPGPKLSMKTGNWHSWNESLTRFMRAQALLGYVNGTIRCPEVSREPENYMIWKQNDDIAAGALLVAIEIDQGDGITSSTDTAKAIYDKLKDRHAQEGPVKQTNLITSTLATRIGKGDKDFMEKTARIWDNIEELYNMGGGTLSQDLFTSFAYLNAISNDYPQLRTLILRDLTNKAPANPDGTPHLYAREIRTLVEREGTLTRDLDNKQSGHDTALAVTGGRGGRTRPTLYCDTCKGNTHTKPYCIRQGGGMEGKTIEESKAKRLADRMAGKPGGGPSRKTVAVQGPKGQVFFTDASSLIPLHTSLSSSSSAPTGFAGIASSHIHELSESDKPITDYGWIALEEETSLIKCDDSVSVDWTKYARNNVALAILSNSPSPNDSPYADTGASVTLSYDQHDFRGLRPANGRAVKGLGGSSIAAEAVGDMVLATDTGEVLIIRDALYIPRSAVKLISVSQLARQHQVISHFDESGCWFTHKTSGQLIGRGTLSPSRHLYALNTQPLDKRAFVATHEPNWESWHNRFGHAAYETIYAMARKGLVEGMPTLLPPDKPPKCELLAFCDVM